MLPKGYKIVPYYDRTGLVYKTLHTVLENLRWEWCWCFWC